MEISKKSNMLSLTPPLFAKGLVYVFKHPHGFFFVVDLFDCFKQTMILLFLLLNNFFLYFFDVSFSYLTFILELRLPSKKKKKLFLSFGALVKKLYRGCPPKIYTHTLNNYKGGVY